MRLMKSTKNTLSFQGTANHKRTLQFDQDTQALTTTPHCFPKKSAHQTGMFLVGMTVSWKESACLFFRGLH